MSVPTEVRIKIVLLMDKFESATVVQRKLRAELGKSTPTEYCIRTTFERFCETSTVEDRPRSGRPTVITEDKVNEVNDARESHPGWSVRSLAQACSIPQTTTYRIMTEYLLLKPYKVQFVQQFYEEDCQDRVEMCKILLPLLTDHKNEKNIFFSDEAAFHLNGLVNKHNVRYWSEENPHVSIETVMQSPKLNVWCAMSEDKLTGPFFFDGDTINGQEYLTMLQDFFIPEMRRLRKVNFILFQQDEALPHFTRGVRQFLDNIFSNRK